MNRRKLLSPVLEVANNYHAAIHGEVAEGIKETTVECSCAISEDSTRPEIPWAGVGGAVALANNDFAKLLHECILDELEELIGESTSKVILFHLKLDQDIANPREFHRRLEFLFSKGAMILERSIVDGLYRRLNISCEEASPFEFEKCVDRARKVFAAKTKGE